MSSPTPASDLESENIRLVHRYLSAVERGAVGEELAAFYAPEVVQHEYPNRLLASGATRDLSAILQSAVRGQAAVAEQRYAIRSIVASGDTVGLEVDWSARLKIALGKLAVGEELRARLAMFITLENGRIVSQRNYDCFEPF